MPDTGGTLLHAKNSIVTQPIQSDFDARRDDLCKESEGEHHELPDGIMVKGTFLEHQGNATGDGDWGEESEEGEEGPSRRSFAGNTTVTLL
jgi:hypothetical protein